jgi:hypothetical protein
MTQAATKNPGVQEYAPPAPGAGTSAEACPTCGERIDATFCRTCGERRPSDRIYTLREFAHEAFEVVTNVERSFLRTCRDLVRRPGQLTAAYMRGERSRYLRPLQLFLLVNVVYFLWAGWTEIHVFNTRFSNHIEHMTYSGIVKPIAEQRVAASGLTRSEFAGRFDDKSLLLARSLIVVMVPLFALAVAAVSFRGRRSAPAVQHLVFSLHFFSVLLLLTIATMYVVVAMLALWSVAFTPPQGWQFEDKLAVVTMIVGVLAYLVPAFRRAYGDGKTVAVVKSLVLVVALAFIIEGFRLFLFLVTIRQL